MNDLSEFRLDLPNGQQVSLADFPNLSHESKEGFRVLFWSIDEGLFQAPELQPVLDRVEHRLFDEYSLATANTERDVYADASATILAFKPRVVVILADLSPERGRAKRSFRMSKVRDIFDFLLGDYQFSPSQIVVHEWFWGLNEPPVGNEFFEASRRIADIPGGMFVPTELYESLKYIFEADIPGDIVEYGVWKGRSLYFIAWLTQRLSKRPRKILGFDTFSGFGDSSSNENDHFMSSSFAKHSKYARLSGGSEIYTDTSREAVAHLLRDFDNIELVEGDIRDTISTVEGRQVALAFFDMDDYSPTAAALDVTYRSLQPGGIIIHDHFSTPTLLRGACFGQRIAMQRFLATHPMFSLCNSNTFLKPPNG